MSELAKNQLEFQKYNATMNGPSSPISMDALKANADKEAVEQAAMGKVFDATTQSYVEREQVYEAGANLPTPIKPAEEVVVTSDDESSALGKRKQGAITDFDKSTYEVYTTTPVADAFGNKTTRVIYMGREHYSCAKDARDVADLLRAKGMETFVFRCNRTPVKNRKRVKGPPRQKKPAVKKPKLKSINDVVAWDVYKNTILGNWQFLDENAIHSRGKQKIWFILNTLNMNGSPANDEVRAAALCMKQCMAHEAVAYLEANSGLGSFIDDLPYHCNGDTDKAKVRQMTLRIRQRLPGYKPMVRVSKPIPQFSLVDPDMAISSGMSRVAHASGVSLPANAAPMAHPHPASPVYTD